MRFTIDHDLHIHSFLSLCSEDENQIPENILAYAKKNHLKKICLTDHVWDTKVCSFTGTHFYAEQTIPHIKQALPLPQDAEVEFYFGCETEMDKQCRVGMAKESFDEFDFVIIPTTHMHMKGFVLDEKDNSIEGRAARYIDRLDALLDMDLPFHKIGIAHPTCSCIGSDWEQHIEVMKAIPDQELYRVFSRLAKSGAGFELNIYYIFKYTEEQLPHLLRFYRIAKECGCKFYLGSDAHSLKDLDGAMAIFERIIDLTGLEESDKFRPLG